MDMTEREKFSGRLFALGLKPHLKGYAYLLAGAERYAASGTLPTEAELAAACGVAQDHLVRALDMCAVLAEYRTGRHFENGRTLLRAVAATEER